MSSWTPEALAAALAALTAGVCASAVQLARTYSQVVNLVEGLNRGGVPIRGAKGSGASVRPDSVGRPTSSPAVRSVLPLDPVNQLAGLTVTPVSAPTGPVDCGPACVVSTITEIKGCWSADELLRFRYFGVIDDRLTTADDLAGMLQDNGIAAHVRKNVDAATARQEIVRNWQAGRPSILLGEWVAVGVGHWVKFVGDRNGPIVMNPWPGSQAPRTWEEFASKFWGDYVHVDGELTPSSGVAM